MDCALCRAVLLTPIVREDPHWRVAINLNQNLLGKLIVVLRRHEESVAALTPAEWKTLHTDVQWCTDALRRAFAPDHFNYAFLQNQDRHVHLHVIPRYATPRWLASFEYADPDWPDHYAPRAQRHVGSDEAAMIAESLLSSAGPRP